LEIRELIRRMSRANLTWGAPRILGELHTLGIEVAKSSVEKHMARHRKPPSPTCRGFLKNHATDPVASDFFVVPTVRFRSPISPRWAARISTASAKPLEHTQLKFHIASRGHAS